MIQQRRSVLSLLGLLAVASCGGDDLTGVEEVTTVSLVVVSGDGQRWVAGQELPDPVVVLVTKENRKGRVKPAKNVLVNFRVTEGGGTVFAGAALTNKDGIAQEYFTLGSEPGPNAVEVRAVDGNTGEKQVFGRFTAQGVARPDELTSIRALSDDAWASLLVQRLDIAAEVQASLDLISASLGDVLDLAGAEEGLATAEGLLAPAGANPVEQAVLGLFVTAMRTFLDAAIQEILVGS